MSILKRLAGETAIYGLSSIIGRSINFLLVPFYTQIFAAAEYGIVTDLYAWTAFFMILFTHRMETAYFRFTTDELHEKNSFSTALISIIGASLLIACMIILFRQPIANFLLYPNAALYVATVAGILALDALTEIPFARLRLERKAIRFASYKIINIILNVGFNLFFFLACPWILNQDGMSGLQGFISSVYNPDIGVGYVFISNLIASAFTLLLLSPYYFKFRLSFDSKLWRTMLSYSSPLIIVGFAGIVNEMLDRTLLKYLLPGDLENNMTQLGIYGANYKLAMLLALFTQAFRYAAEPFFFEHKKDRNAPKDYAKVALLFVLVGSVGFLSISLFLPELKEILLRRDVYHEGIMVVPILLMANLFLGIYYNLSVWYKLTDKTVYAMWIALGGAVLTVILNIIWIPVLGYEGSAWATLIVYFAMTVSSYLIGKGHYPIPYQVIRILLYLLAACAIYLICKDLHIALRGFALIGYLAVAYLLEKDNLKAPA